MASPFYPLDITGVNASNRIPDEQHTVQIPTGAMASFFVPTFAPFNGNNIVVKHGAPGNQTTLTKGVHYVLRHHFKHAKEALGKDFYGSVMLLDRTLSGQIFVTYNTLGGVYATDVGELIKERTNSFYAQQTVLWDQIVGVPELLPPIAHDHDAEDLQNWDDLIAATDRVTDAISDPNNTNPLLATIHQMLLQHIEDESNPHNTSKGDVLLNAVANHPPATDAQARDENNTTTAMTPHSTYVSIVEHFAGLLQPHVDDHSLHPQSPGDIGLGEVQNFGVANLTQAYAGTTDQKYMLPSLMKAAVTGAMSAPTTATLPSQFLGLSCRVDGSNNDVPAEGTAQWLVMNTYAGSLSQAPTLTTQRYQLILSLGSGSAFRGLYFRVQNNATPQSWIRLDGGTRATPADVYQENAEAYLTPETVDEALLKASSSQVSSTNPVGFLGAVGYFNGTGTPDEESTWQIKNIYSSELAAAPSSSATRMQIATEIHSGSSSVPMRTFTRAITNGTPSSDWIQSGSNLTSVPNWGPAQETDMVHDTQVDDRFVSPVNVRQFTENRFGTFLNRVTCSTSQPGAPSNARVGDVHFQIT